jgi:tetratricopeptide (TPR) repeat protein
MTAQQRDEAMREEARSFLDQFSVTGSSFQFDKGKRDLVAAEAAAAIKDNPASDYAYVAAAKTYAALGQSDEAMEAFSRALAIKQYAYIYVNRAAVRPPSDYGGRMADLDAALKLEPENPDALAAKARLLSNRKDYSGALAVLDRMKPDPNDLGAALERAIVLTKAGRTADAQKIFAEVREKAKAPGQLNSLCWSKATAGVMLESAVQDCRDALKPDPGNSQYQDSLGMALLKLGKLDEALDAYNKAIADNRRAASLMGRAFVYWRKGERERAAEDAAAARKISPKIDDAFAAYGLKFDGPATAPAAASPASSKSRD